MNYILFVQKEKSRYYKEIPPGFKDGKTKDGIDKYNDLILWKEVLKYCRENDKNLIFVTDDVKPDWWTGDGTKKEFHSLLIKEFKEVTCKDILALNSQQLYGILGDYIIYLHLILFRLFYNIA